MNIQPNFYYLSMDDLDMIYSPSNSFVDSNDYISESPESFEDPDSDYEPGSHDSGMVLVVVMIYDKFHHLLPYQIDNKVVRTIFIIPSMPTQIIGTV
jgi:hypothetical protein